MNLFCVHSFIREGVCMCAPVCVCAPSVCDPLYVCVCMAMTLHILVTTVSATCMLEIMCKCLIAFAI